MKRLDFSYVLDEGSRFELALTSDEEMTPASVALMATYICMFFLALKKIPGIDMGHVDVETLIRDLMKGEQ